MLSIYFPFFERIGEYVFCDTQQGCRQVALCRRAAYRCLEYRDVVVSLVSDAGVSVSCYGFPGISGRVDDYGRFQDERA